MNEPSSKRKAARHVSIYALGSIIRQLVGFIMLPVYTSYLSPSDYGVVSLLVVMVSLCEVLIGARFGQAMPKFFYEQADSEWRNTVVSTALLVTACISVLVTLLVIASSNPISSLLFGTGNYSDHGDRIIRFDFFQAARAPLVLHGKLGLQNAYPVIAQHLACGI